MAEFLIKDEEFAGLKDKVVVLTGGSSGIGLAIVTLLLSQEEPINEASNKFTFVKTDVTKWADLLVLFKTAKEIHGHIDHVVANAGLGPRTDYLATEVDENGDLKEPTYDLLDVSLKGAMNTTTLGVYYIRQQPEGGSLVIIGSSTGIQRLRAIDYTTAKHGILGFGRGLVPVLTASKLPIRVNIIAPTWTDSSILPHLKDLMAAINVEIQPASAVARAAALVMADPSRHGQVIYVARGRYKEIDESVLLPAADQITGDDYPAEDEVLRRLLEVVAASTAAPAAATAAAA
ncbi:hypothetical protein BX600DRAFT_472176 [Xylariales sp. PMI_506]|nr:hypothetical protein BX600DRAFT_472176 [Xylariales sp. PMI_506]